MTDNKSSLTPREITVLLDKYIIGQSAAKRCVAIALRNRWRRQQVSGNLRDEIMPKNIIMIGPTGVGKTEIARRIAKIVSAPFIKVEASKYTEVGYVGRDVESMVRDLTETSIKMSHEKKIQEVEEIAREKALQRVLDIFVPPTPSSDDKKAQDDSTTREKFYKKIKAGKFDDQEITFETEERSGNSLEIFPLGAGNEGLDLNMREMMSNFLPKKNKEKTATVSEALKFFQSEEAEKLVDMEKLHQDSIQKVENDGIIFIDEIDKVATRHESGSADISREGVQRDLLPIVEGSSVTTKYGQVRTDHILFIAAGAFHVSKPSDLIPELQGRFPIRVELNSLEKDDFIKILTEPTNSLTKQYIALLETEEIELIFEQDAIEELALLACEVNERTENIGARRLHTLLEKTLDEISFIAPEYTENSIIIDRAYVQKQLKDIVVNRDLSRYIL